MVHHAELTCQLARRPAAWLLHVLALVTNGKRLLRRRCCTLPLCALPLLYVFMPHRQSHGGKITLVVIESSRNASITFAALAAQRGTLATRPHPFYSHVIHSLPCLTSFTPMPTCKPSLCFSGLLCSPLFAQETALQNHGVSPQLPNPSSYYSNPVI